MTKAGGDVIRGEQRAGKFSLLTTSHGHVTSLTKRVPKEVSEFVIPRQKLDGR